MRHRQADPGPLGSLGAPGLSAQTSKQAGRHGHLAASRRNVPHWSDWPGYLVRNRPGLVDPGHCAISYVLWVSESVSKLVRAGTPIPGEGRGK